MQCAYDWFKNKGKQLHKTDNCVYQSYKCKICGETKKERIANKNNTMIYIAEQIWQDIADLEDFKEKLEYYKNKISFAEDRLAINKERLKTILAEL